MIRLLKRFGLAAGVAGVSLLAACPLLDPTPLDEQVSTFAADFVRQVLAAALL